MKTLSSKKWKFLQFRVFFFAFQITCHFRRYTGESWAFQPGAQLAVCFRWVAVLPRRATVKTGCVEIQRVELRMYRRTRTSSGGRFFGARTPVGCTLELWNCQPCSTSRVCRAEIHTRPPHFVYIIRCQWEGVAALGSWCVQRAVFEFSYVFLHFQKRSDFQGVISMFFDYLTEGMIAWSPRIPYLVRGPGPPAPGDGLAPTEHMVF